MAGPVYNRLFSSKPSVSFEEEFGLTRKKRTTRLREIISIVRKHKLTKGVTPAEFRAVFEDLGPTFVKVGQILSTRSEILPQAYCDELSKLQTSTAPLPFDQIEQALRAVYEDRFDSIFQEIDPEPLGSASLAQVHAATLSNGDKVAVKIQRPGVRSVMAQDIDVIRSIMRRLSRVMGNDQIVDFNGVVEELWATFLEETDFTKEAENLCEFALCNKDVDYVACPAPYLEYCTPDVLVMEYIDGIPIREPQRATQAGYNLEDLGNKIMENYAKQILDDGFFHADPHPGNIVFSGGKVVYLDLGITGRLNARERATFGEIVAAVGTKNSGKLKDSLIAFADEKNVYEIDHPKLLAALDALLDSYASCDVADIDIGDFLTDIINVTKQFKVKLPSSVTAVCRALVTLEGTVLAYVGSFNIADIINRRLRKERSDPDKMVAAVESLAVDLRVASEGLRDAALYSGEAMKMVSRGQFKMNMEMQGSDEPLQKLSRIVNRMSMGLMIAGLLVSAALVSSTTPQVPVFGLPLLSFLMYVSAFIMSVFVVVDIFRKPKR
ncbi:MAG: AarF/UbiB family protein [Coriobacteriia bacterium]|nr:AarF/UbiB family protein [Coriobacteriia bacterium]